MKLKLLNLMSDQGMFSYNLNIVLNIFLQVIGSPVVTYGTVNPKDPGSIFSLGTGNYIRNMSRLSDQAAYSK